MTTKTNHRIHPYSIVDAKLWLLVVCSLERVSWIQEWLLPCPIKVITGIDCPGCGFQRSLLALLQGHWQESYSLYPPTVPLLIVLLYALLKSLFGFDRRHIVMKLLAVACGWFVLGVYLARSFFYLYRGQ